MTQHALIAICESEDFFEAIEKVYDKVPSGTCKSCTRCCSESVNISAVELLNIINYMEKEGLFEDSDLIRRVIRYYILELAKPMKCPFLTAAKQCQIYSVRPLPCRIFGNRTEAAYDANYQAVKAQNVMTAKRLWDEEGLLIPKSVWGKEIGYCMDYIRTQTLSEEDVADLYSDLIQIDGKLYFASNEVVIPQARDLVSEMIQVLLDKAHAEVIDQALLAQLRRDVLPHKV